MISEADKLAVRSADVVDRLRIARRSNIQPELLYFLAADPSPEVRREVANNPSTPWRADAILVEDEDESVRRDLSAKLANLLPGRSQAAREKVRGRVIELIEILVRDEAERVRFDGDRLRSLGLDVNAARGASRARRQIDDALRRGSCRESRGRSAAR